MSLTMLVRNHAVAGTLPEMKLSAELLSDTLERVVACPEQVGQLYELLGHYFHQCRNHLNSLNISIYLAKRVESSTDAADWRDVERHYREVEQFFDRLQWICRPMPLTRVESSFHYLIEGRVEAWREMLAHKGRHLVLEPPASAAVGYFDPSRLERAFDELVTWRCALGDPSDDLRIRWEAQSGWFLVEWDEPRGTRSRVRNQKLTAELLDIEPPISFPALTLPMLSRVMSVHGGSVVESNREPWRIQVSWPLALPTS